MKRRKRIDTFPGYIRGAGEYTGCTACGFVDLDDHFDELGLDEDQRQCPECGAVMWPYFMLERDAKATGQRTFWT